MNRISFLLSFLGISVVAKAQTAIAGINLYPEKPHRFSPWEKYPPKNNQCPVCGTMAAPYHITGIKCGGILGDPGDFNSCSKRILTRCQRCNAAFWQDAA